ncbi:MAG: CDP-alcohol phosphatidyltransferase family protein [Candidatus Brockarchaeota archaeon]|nr:CDP-alcohol phosphatidyltransferase family protein [Candidatus Brockarchaeota archaeon]
MRAIILATEKDFIFDEDRPLALVKVCSIPLIARILNSIRAAGIREALIVLGFKGEEIRKMLKDGEEIGLRLFYLQAGGYEVPVLKEFLDDDLLVISADLVIDTEFVTEIMKIEGNVACYLNDRAIGVYKLDREYSRLFQYDFTSNLSKILEEIEAESIKLDVAKMEMEHVELKRKVSPICVKIDSRNSIELAKRKLVFRTQKGLHFTSYINKSIEDHLIYRIAEVSWITPNRITILTNLLAYTVATLFLSGCMRIAVILAYIVGILDGLDGKLARVRGILTKLGYIEHTFDMLYEQTWYVCFALSLYFLESSYLPLVLGLCMLLVDSFVRHCYMQFKETMGKALTAYTNFDRAFAKVDGRRNVYVLYMVLFSWIPWLGKPLYAMYAMLTHSSVTAVIYVIRAIQHMSAVDKAEGLKGFLKLVGKPD